MKKEDYSKWKRGPIIPTPANKMRITIRIDNDILNWFRDQVSRAGGGNYQTLMNDALRAYMDARDSQAESLVRRVVREELAEYSVRKNRPSKAKKR